MSSNGFNVCVVCAVDEEFKAFVRMLTKMYQQSSVQKRAGRDGRPFRSALIQNEAGKDISLHLSLALDPGPLAMITHLKNILAEFTPQFVAMTGFCAGDQRKVNLGDLVVAERAFFYESGSVERNQAGELEPRSDVTTYRPDPTTLIQARLFNGWQEDLKRLTTRPPSRIQQRDWLLDHLSQMSPMNVKAIPLDELKIHVPDWRLLVAEMQQGEKPWLSRTLTLLHPERVESLRYGSEEFPFHDGELNNPYIEAMASGSAVRHDNVNNALFQQVQMPVRSAIAVDMEAATLYQVISQDYPTLARLVVKGVCDYAAPEKNDTYHAYAAEAAAVYMLCFLREHITASSSLAPVEQVKAEGLPEDVVPGGYRVYSCCAPEDLTYLKELQKHLSPYIRQKRLALWWTYDQTLGRERREERIHYQEQAQIVLVLISPDLVYNETAMSEIKYFAERYIHGQTRVIPIRLRPTNAWKDIPFGQNDTLRSIMGLPYGDGFMVTDGKMHEVSFMNVASAVWDLCNSRR